jgi:hypothetical protein
LPLGFKRSLDRSSLGLRPFPMHSAVWVFACMLFGARAQALIETPFQRIQYGAPNTIVLLYWLNDPSTDAVSRQLLESAETVARVRLFAGHYRQSHPLIRS